MSEFVPCDENLMNYNFSPDTGRQERVRNLIFRNGMDVILTRSIPCTGTLIEVESEIQTFARVNYGSEKTIVKAEDTIILDGEQDLIGGTTFWNEPHTHVNTGTEVVSGLSGVYTRNTDYTINYESGTITRTSSGNILFGETVSISYSFFQPCLDPKTGTSRRTCRICNTFGYIELSPVTIRGLFHTPKYDSNLTLAGFWETGDAFFTVPELSDFKHLQAEPVGIDGFFVRDFLVIDGKYWVVMTKPESGNLRGQYLGRRYHIRMISSRE